MPPSSPGFTQAPPPPQKEKGVPCFYFRLNRTPLSPSQNPLRGFSLFDVSDVFVKGSRNVRSSGTDPLPLSSVMDLPSRRNQPSFDRPLQCFFDRHFLRRIGRPWFVFFSTPPTWTLRLSPLQWTRPPLPELSSEAGTHIPPPPILLGFPFASPNFMAVLPPFHPILALCSPRQLTNFPFPSPIPPCGHAPHPNALASPPLLCLSLKDCKTPSLSRGVLSSSPCPSSQFFFIVPPRKEMCRFARYYWLLPSTKAYPSPIPLSPLFFFVTFPSPNVS